MDNEIKEVIQENEDVKAPEVELPTQEDLAEGENIFNLAMSRIKDMGLNWTLRSVDYLINREDVTQNQLRSCVYKKANGEIIYDVYKSCVYIITSGLVNPKTTTKEEYVTLIEKAKDLIDEWREDFGNIGILQIMLINVMQVKHRFFIGRQDVKVLDYMSSESLQKDLIMNTIAMDLQVKVAQSQAINS